MSGTWITCTIIRSSMEWQLAHHAWPHSSFSRCVREHLYAPDWCCVCDGRLVNAPDSSELESTVGE